MKTFNKYVGLDVHKDTTVIAVAEGGREDEVRLIGQISSDLHALEKVLRKLGGEGVTLHVVYEAGSTGYVVYRRLQQLKIDCIVVAPSCTPQPKGQRQKTDRRDALMLAKLHRAGELMGIHVPDAIDESIRDLTRARADAVHARLLREPPNTRQATSLCNGIQCFNLFLLPADVGGHESIHAVQDADLPGALSNADNGK